MILGGTGMLGHKIHEVLSRHHDVVSTTRRTLADLPVDPTPFFTLGRVVEHVDVTDTPALTSVIEEVAPEVVINCVGIVKQRDAAHDPVPSIEINALLPHLLRELCAKRAARLIHFSTDCVFSGATGAYTEDDPSDAQDLYGRTKYLGEVVDGDVLTIRTSIIGRELDHFGSLVEWFLSQRGQVHGFRKAIYSGLTTIQLTDIVGTLLTDHPDLRGLYQVASTPIDKYNLLLRLRDRMHLTDELDVTPDDSFVCDRSLRGDRFAAATGITVPSWDEMLVAFAADAPRYDRVTA